MSSFWKKAFTIIESLVIIGIISILTTVALASYSSFTETSKLKSEVHKFISALSLAQKKAVSGEDVSGYCSNCSFHSYIVTYTADGGYTIQGQYALDVTPTTPVPYSTPTSYSIDTSNGNVSILDSGTVTFSKLTGTPDSAKTVRFKSAVKGECIQVAISAVGLLSSDSPYSC